MNNKPWVFIDVSYLAYRAMYSLQGMSVRDEPTSVIFGFLDQIQHVCADDRVRSNRVALFFDSPLSVRRDFFPEYKSKRHDDKTPEQWEDVRAMKQQVNRLRTNILPQMGFRCYRQNGLESDDMIAQAATQTHDKVIIVTADNDLFQCITDSVHWYDPQRKLYYDKSVFTQAMRVSPFDWVDVKSIAGCASDNVPGVGGVGEKTAIDYLWKLLPQTYKKYQRIVSQEGQRVMDRNRLLVSLPHPRTERVDLQEPQYNPQAFEEWGAKLKMQSWFTTRARQWKEFFSGCYGANEDMLAMTRKRERV